MEIVQLTKKSDGRCTIEVKRRDSDNIEIYHGYEYGFAMGNPNFIFIMTDKNEDSPNAVVVNVEDVISINVEEIK